MVLNARESGGRDVGRRVRDGEGTGDGGRSGRLVFEGSLASHAQGDHLPAASVLGREEVTAAISPAPPPPPPTPPPRSRMRPLEDAGVTHESEGLWIDPRRPLTAVDLHNGSVVICNVSPAAAHVVDVKSAERSCEAFEQLGRNQPGPRLQLQFRVDLIRNRLGPVSVQLPAPGSDSPLQITDAPTCGRSKFRRASSETPAPPQGLDVIC
ncbi:unnamed protein product [Pleuronectes platessa]|uniref:Uncharacterized protein n=1 Tax=Pleuronectes platessa TaxID=8262 RepID=A0A9N7Y6F5_PLEPL|nr:unnamed protein product [Pleuronectes platessa]